MPASTYGTSPLWCGGGSGRIAGSRLDSIPDRPRTARAAGGLYEIPSRAAPRAELLVLVGLGDATDGGEGVLRRHEASARPRDSARARARGAVSRRAHYGARPGQPRTVWDEVRRLNPERGMTIFLTTQYLEEADRLRPDRDHRQGRDRCAGTPDELKSELGKGRHRRRPSTQEQRETRAVPLRPLPDRARRRRRRGVSRCTSTAARAGGGARRLVAAARRRGHPAGRRKRLRRPSLDDVFLAFDRQTHRRQRSSRAEER